MVVTCLINTVLYVPVLDESLHLDKLTVGAVVNDIGKVIQLFAGIFSTLPQRAINPLLITQSKPESFGETMGCSR